MYIIVQVVYALPEKQYFCDVKILEFSTIESVIKISGILKIQKDINLKINKVGVYGKLVKLTDIAKNGDRIEIYRPLISFFKKSKIMY